MHWQVAGSMIAMDLEFSIDTAGGNAKVVAGFPMVSMTAELIKDTHHLWPGGI